jgi:hypothetical protein
MPTGLESVLSLLPGATGYGLLAAVTAFVLRYAYLSDKRWRDEVADHERTQKLYDDERVRRREVEDQVAELRREVVGLRADVAKSRTELAQLRGELSGG